MKEKFFMEDTIYEEMNVCEIINNKNDLKSGKTAYAVMKASNVMIAGD